MGTAYGARAEMWRPKHWASAVEPDPKRWEKLGTNWYRQRPPTAPPAPMRSCREVILDLERQINGGRQLSPVKK